MARSSSTFVKQATMAFFAVALLFPTVASAQGGDGFLFRQPKVTLKFESGYGFQRAGSDLFDFVTDSLTLGRRDFDSPYVGGEIGIRVAERWDVAIAVGYQESSVASEYRDWVDADDRPIEQVTSLRQVPFTVSAKYYLRERGRSIGRFAWIPNAISPFVGGGVGVVSYRFEQDGDFVDYQTFDIFRDNLRTDGDAFLARAVAGVNVSLSKQFFFTAEGRFGYASGDVAGDFSGFDKMDLAGLQLVGGLAVRF
jgi:hypothetical protein